MKTKSRLIKKIEELEEIINEIIPVDKEHFYNKKMVNTRERLKDLINQIKKLNPKKNKIEIQDLLSNINGIFGIFSKDPKRKEFQALYAIFEEVNPAWIPFDKILFKITDKINVSDEEWLILAKDMLESMSKKEIDIDLASGCTNVLMFPMAQNAGIIINEEIGELFWDIELLSDPGGPTNIHESKVQKEITMLISKTKELMKKYAV